jgi:hypothetical protein
MGQIVFSRLLLKLDLVLNRIDHNPLDRLLLRFWGDLPRIDNGRKFRNDDGWSFFSAIFVCQTSNGSVRNRRVGSDYLKRRHPRY